MSLNDEESNSPANKPVMSEPQNKSSKNLKKIVSCEKKYRKTERKECSKLTNTASCQTTNLPKKKKKEDEEKKKQNVKYSRKKK